MDPLLNAAVKTHVNAAKITRQSKSNLALAFISLGRERKRDITIFYAFCRVIDDIADSSELSVAEKRVRLEAWRKMLRAAPRDEPVTFGAQPVAAHARLDKNRGIAVGQGHRKASQHVRRGSPLRARGVRP